MTTESVTVPYFLKYSWRSSEEKTQKETNAVSVLDIGLKLSRSKWTLLYANPILHSAPHITYLPLFLEPNRLQRFSWKEIQASVSFMWMSRTGNSHDFEVKFRNQNETRNVKDLPDVISFCWTSNHSVTIVKSPETQKSFLINDKKHEAMTLHSAGGNMSRMMKHSCQFLSVVPHASWFLTISLVHSMGV